MDSKRNVNLDLARCAAVLGVISVHFFLNSGFFYEDIVAGRKMYVAVIIRTACMVCVPMFMLLTGYLRGNKHIDFNIKWVKKLSHIIGIYIIVTLIILIFRSAFTDYEPNVKNILENIFGYGQYSWYVEFYIGLFLLTPFLNLIWEGLETITAQRNFVLVLIFMTILPTAVNSLDITTPGALFNPALSEKYFKIIPDWWGDFYPLTYYFTGAYIAKWHSGIRDNKASAKYFAMYCACVLIFGTVAFWQSYNRSFTWGLQNFWNGYCRYIDCILLFMAIISLDFKFPAFIAAAVRKVSQLSFGIYLSSWIGDNLFVYPFLKSNISVGKNRLFFFIPAVRASFAIAFVISWGAEIIYSTLAKFAGRLCNTAAKSKNIPE